MTTTTKLARRAATAVAALSLTVAAQASAGAKARAAGTVGDEALRVEGALAEMALSRQEFEVHEDWGRAVASNDDGRRLPVRITPLDEDECEADVRGAEAVDADMESRFLRLLQAR